MCLDNTGPPAVYGREPAAPRRSSVGAFACPVTTSTEAGSRRRRFPRAGAVPRLLTRRGAGVEPPSPPRRPGSASIRMGLAPLEQDPRSFAPILGRHGGDPCDPGPSRIRNPDVSSGLGQGPWPTRSKKSPIKPQGAFGGLFGDPKVRQSVPLMWRRAAPPGRDRPIPHLHQPAVGTAPPCRHPPEPRASAA